MEIKAIRGFNDILPYEIGKWQFFQVGEGAARPFIEALARFEQAEMLH